MNIVVRLARVTRVMLDYSEFVRYGMNANRSRLKAVVRTVVRSIRRPRFTHVLRENIVFYFTFFLIKKNNYNNNLL